MCVGKPKILLLLCISQSYAVGFGGGRLQPFAKYDAVADDEVGA